MSEAVGAQQRRLLFADASRVLPGLYAWLATVLLPVLQPGVAALARASASVAALALLAAFPLLGARPRLARQLAIYVFLLGCFGAWLGLGTRLRSDQLDPVRSALGGLGFLLHALAWGAPNRAQADAAPSHLLPGSPLQPRSSSPRIALGVLAVGIGLALVPSLVAFSVERPGSSLLAHALALGCGLLLIAAWTDIALRVGKPQQFPLWHQRGRRAAWSLGTLTLTVGIGLLWLSLR